MPTAVCRALHSAVSILEIMALKSHPGYSGAGWSRGMSRPVVGELSVRLICRQPKHVSFRVNVPALSPCLSVRLGVSVRT